MQPRFRSCTVGDQQDRQHAQDQCQGQEDATPPHHITPCDPKKMTRKASKLVTFSQRDARKDAPGVCTHRKKLDHTLARKNDSPTWCGVIVVVWCYCGGVVLLWWCGVTVVVWCYCGSVFVVV